MIDLATFQTLPTAEIARRVRAAGPKVCVFPINGTRRWFMLEYPGQRADGSSAYLDVIVRRYAEIFQLCFDHGLDTLLTPCFGPDVMERGDDYMRMAAEGFAHLATHPAFVDFFQAYAVRVRFYGDHRPFLAPTPYAYLSDLLEGVTDATLAHQRHRLFFGLFAHDATATVAALAVRFFQQQGRIPTKQELVAAYYGEEIGPVDLFIGFDKFAAFDMPLVATGKEDLYFTVNPSPYFNQRQLRAILYDHLYTRREEPDYATLTPADWAWLCRFYQANQEQTQGVGALHGGIWFPLPQVTLLEGDKETRRQGDRETGR